MAYASVPASVSSPPIKIVLKGGTSIPLNDRFTKMIKERSRDASQTRGGGARSSAALEYTASTKNRRLAQQMSKRPAVAAELGLEHTHSRSQPQPAMHTNLKQRLGRTNIQGRLGVASSARGRLGPVALMSAPVRRGRGGVQQRTTFTRSGVRGRTGVQATRGRGGFRGRGIARGGSRGRGQSRGRGARGRGQVSRGRGRGGKPVSRENLDSELDAYMSHTKGSLDAELDAYMAEAPTN